MVGDVMEARISKWGFTMEDAAVGMGNSLATCSKHYNINKRADGAQRVADGLDGYREAKRQRVGEVGQQQEQQQQQQQQQHQQQQQL